MRVFVLSALVLVSVSGSSLSSRPALGSLKIVGGHVVQRAEDAPFMVYNSDGCGGTLIAPNWVLSAGHCQAAFEEGASYVNLLRLDQLAQATRLKVKKTFRHPKYRVLLESSEYDFLLVQLEQSVAFNGTTLKPIRLADAETERLGLQAPGKVATTAGWGDTSEWGQSSTDLRFVEVPIVSQADVDAADSYPGLITESMLPAGYAAGGRDSCNGDSGGPLYVVDGGEKIQIGVVSWGHGCARAKKYGVYSKISLVSDWIKQIQTANP